MENGGEIKLGSMLFTLVDPHRGREVDFNRWYERDHYYAGCMIGPWLFAGRRWVATKALKDLRKGSQPELFGPAGSGSYVGVYWVLEGKHDDHFGWALDQVKWLHANGRMFAERDHIHTLLYRLAWTIGPADGVPAELALDHPYQGMVATLLAADRQPTELVPGTLTVAFKAVPLDPTAPVSQQGLEGIEDRMMVLTFLEHEPTAADVPSGPDVVWSAPFIPTIPGTDTYTDELW